MRIVVPFLVATFALGCGGGAATHKADGRHLTPFQVSRLLGHYATLDGKTGFVLDRTSEPYLVRFDGTEQLLELREQPGPHGTKEYAANDPKAFWMRVDADGSVLLFDGPAEHEGVEVTRDADADPLR